MAHEQSKTREQRTLSDDKRIVIVLRRYGVEHAGVFGSFAMGESHQGSDIDVLIDLREDMDLLFDLVGLRLDLETRWGARLT